MKFLYYITFFFSFVFLSQSIKAGGGGGCSGPVPTNDDCSNAVTLIVDDILQCSSTHSACPATIQTGECIVNFPGVTEQTLWYRFTATNDSLVLDFLTTNTPSCPPLLTVYGPFAAGSGCLPSCTTPYIYLSLMDGDPGTYVLLTDLNTTTGNNEYLVQVQGNQCGGPGDDQTDFCIGIYNPTKNTTPNGSSYINSCGTTFNGSTGGGYYPSGTSSGFNNLDGNNSTTCIGCAETGDDVPFILNNDSWFSFCPITTGTWQVTFNVGTCVFFGNKQRCSNGYFNRDNIKHDIGHFSTQPNSSE